MEFTFKDKHQTALEILIGYSKVKAEELEFVML